MAVSSLKLRHRLLAGAFSFIQPGVGQLYKGEVRKAASFLAFHITLLLLYFAYMAFGCFEWKRVTFITVPTLLVSQLVNWTWSWIDALRRHPHTYQRKWYSRWYTCLGLITAILFLPSGDIPGIVRASYVEAFKIPSAAMWPTLEIGDHILSTKSHYRSNPISRGDVIIFTLDDDPGTETVESEINIIKRVVGLPGDRIELNGTDLFLNGQKQDEPYAAYDPDATDRRTFAPFLVPAGKLLVLGDNRDHSHDARYWKDPFLPIENVKAKALYIYFSWTGFHRVGLDVK